MSDNITLPREVVEDLLYALVSEQSQGGDDCYADSITALRTALAAEQPKPEPVGWMLKGYSPDVGPYVDFRAEEEMSKRHSREVWTPLYTAPPDIEALRRDAERLKAAALQAQNAAIDLTKKNERLREALEIIAGYRQCVDPLMGNQDVAKAALRREDV